MSVSLHKLSRGFDTFYRSAPVVVPVVNTTNSTNTTTNGTNTTTNGTNSTNGTVNTTAPVVVITPPTVSSLSQVATWFEPKGEVIIFKRPADNVRVQVVMDKATYSPGDTASYTVNVFNTTTNRAITVDSYVSVTVTDVKSLYENGAVSHPASLAQRVHFGSAIRGFDMERVIAGAHLETALAGSQTNASIAYIDALFGVQNWRNGIFDVRSLNNLNSTLKNASPADQQAVNALLGYVLTSPALPNPTVVRPVALRSGV